MKKFALSLFLISLCLFSAFSSISYSIDNYKVQVVVGRDAVHFINEDIAMNFHTAGHGFYRDIPYLFSGSPVHARISNLSVSDKFERESEDGYVSIKIGDADKKIVGVNQYNISYNYDLGVDTHNGYDEFYLDLLGDSWECGTDVFDYEVYLPKEGLKINDIKAWVTTGVYGSAHQLNFKVSEIDGYYVFYGSVNNLRAGQAVTIRIQLPDSWYQGARLPWDATGVFKVMAPYLSLVLVLIAFILWAKYGKDKKPIITARFEAPEGFSPMVVGYLADGSVDDKDIISMIFNWADRGLLTINEKKKDKFSFVKTAEINEDAPKFERNLFNRFFRNCEVGDTLTLSMLQESNFAEAMLSAKVTVAKYFTKERALHSSKARGLAVLSGFASIIPLLLLSASIALTEYSIEGFFACVVISLFVTLLNIVCQWALFRKWYIRKSNIAPCILSAIPCALSILVFYLLESGIVLTLICCICSFVMAIFAIITDKKSDYGQKIFEEILGYREFIDKVSMDELKMMIDKDPEIYYKVLSYAVVLGLENKWAKKFESIAVAQPSWYVGYNTFDIMYYSHMASRMRAVVALNSMPKTTGRSVGGSGFNMSGFAGGGFGGGGGHAW